MVTKKCCNFSWELVGDPLEKVFDRITGYTGLKNYPVILLSCLIFVHLAVSPRFWWGGKQQF